MSPRPNTVRGLGLVFLVVLSIVGVAVPAAGTTGATQPLDQDDGLKKAGSNTTESGASAPTSTIDIEYTLNRTPGDLSTLAITVAVTPPDNLANFTFHTSGVTVIDASGFTQVAPDEWEWQDNASVTTPTLRYRIPSNASGTFGQTAAETDLWAFTGGRYKLPYSYYYYQPAPTVAVSERTVGEGYAGDYWAFMGDYALFETSSSSQSFTYIVPAAATPELATDRVLSYLRALSGEIEIGGRDAAVTMFTVPSPPIRGGGVSVDAEFWVSDDLSLTTIAHEYTHTRQEYRYSDFSARMDWVVEGHAEYRGYYYAWQLGPLSSDQFRQLLVTGEGMSQPLEDVSPTSWTAYEKGALTLAKIDLLIRNRSGGTYSLEDVFRELNARGNSDSQLTLERFETIITQMTGVSVNTTLEQYVFTDTVPTLPSNLTDAYTIRPDFEVTELRAPAVVTQGEPLPIEAVVTNVGESNGTQSVTVRVANMTNVTSSVALDIGESSTINATFPTDGFDPGTYTLSVETANDTRSTQITVQEPDGFQVTNLQAPTNVTAGENVTVTASVDNADDVEATQTVAFRFNGSTVVTKNVTLAGGANTTITFSAPTDSIDPGTYTYGVFTANDSETTQVTVQNKGPGALPGLDNAPTDLDNDGVYEDINGDGVFNIADVQALFANRNSQIVQNNQTAFDFNGDGVFNIADVQTLFTNVIDQFN